MTSKRQYRIIVLNAIKDWINKEYSYENWKEVAEQTGIGVEYFTQQAQYITDDRFSILVQTICSVLKMDEHELSREFVHYWQTDFAPKVYNFMIKKSETIKDFVRGIMGISNDIAHLFPHGSMTKVDFSETPSGSISAVYPTEQALVDIIAVLRGASMFFPQKFQIRKINAHSVEIFFE